MPNRFARPAFALLLSLSLFAVASPAAAVTVNVDFGNELSPTRRYAGLGAAPDPGTVWTQTGWSGGTGTPLLMNDLVDSQGSPTSIDVVVDSNGSATSNWNHKLDQGDVNNQLQLDRLVVDGTNVSPVFGFSGLDPLKTYDVYLYNHIYNNLFEHVGTGATQSTTGLFAQPNPDWTGANGEGSNWVVFRGLSGTNQHLFTVRGLPAANPYGVVSGMQIQEVAPLSQVPEPASLALVAIGIVGLTVAARRRRRGGCGDV